MNGLCALAFRGCNSSIFCTHSGWRMVGYNCRKFMQPLIIDLDLSSDVPRELKVISSFCVHWHIMGIPNLQGWINTLLEKTHPTSHQGLWHILCRLTPHYLVQCRPHICQSYFNMAEANIVIVIGRQVDCHKKLSRTENANNPSLSLTLLFQWLILKATPRSHQLWHIGGRWKRIVRKWSN